MALKIKAVLACLLSLGMFAAGSPQSPRPAADLWGAILALNEPVAAELNLTAEQMRQIRAVVERVDIKYIDDLQRVRSLQQDDQEETRAKGEQEWRKLAGAVNTEERKALNEALPNILEPQQLKRLEQIDLQTIRVDAFSDRRVLNVLHLTEDQKGKIEKLAREATEAISPSVREPGIDARKLESEVNEWMGKLVALLTSEQRQAWSALIGKPFAKRQSMRWYIFHKNVEKVSDPSTGMERIEAAVAALQRLGANIRREPNQPGAPVVAVNFHDRLLKDDDLRHVAALSQVRELDLRGTEISDAGLKHLTGIKQLRHLDLYRTKVTDAGVKDIATLSQLTYLSLWELPVTDAGVKELKALEQLQWLGLQGTDVTDAGMKDVATLKHLQALHVGQTRLTDAAMTDIATLPLLQTLELQATGLTDAGLKGLTPLQTLRWLDVRSTKVTNEGLKELAAFKDLRRLDLFGTQVTDAGLDHLGILDRLEYLSLWDLPVTDDGIKKLLALRNLRYLGLHGTRITGNAMKDVATFTQLRELHLGQTDVTDAGLNELAALTQLQTLGLRQTKVTDNGLKSLVALKNLRELKLEGTPTTASAVKELRAVFSSPLKVDTDKPVGQVPLSFKLALIGVVLAVIVVGVALGYRRGTKERGPQKQLGGR